VIFARLQIIPPGHRAGFGGLCRHRQHDRLGRAFIIGLLVSTTGDFTAGCSLGRLLHHHLARHDSLMRKY